MKLTAGICISVVIMCRDCFMMILAHLINKTTYKMFAMIVISYNYMSQLTSECSLIIELIACPWHFYLPRETSASSVCPLAKLL